MENAEMGKELKTAVSPSAVLFASASEATATWRYTNFVLYCIAEVKMIHNHVLVRSVVISGHHKVSGQVKVSQGYLHAVCQSFCLHIIDICQ